MLKLHLCVPNCCEDLLQHGRGTNYYCLYLFMQFFQVIGIRFFLLFEVMLKPNFADGFFILLNSVSFLYWFHIYQLKTLDFVILLMRFVGKTFNAVFLQSFLCAKCQLENHAILFFMVQVALVALATNPSFHKDLLSTVKSWPSMIYSALPVISAIEPQLNTSSMTDALKEVQDCMLYHLTF